jgi:4'-phosphopantetheinyl transferase
MSILQRFYQKPTLSLDSRAAHVWRVFLPTLNPWRNQFETILSTEERLAANKLQMPGSRESYILRKGILRILIARYTGIPPDMIGFSRSFYGKPEIALPSCQSELQFNLSHSSDWMIVAFAKNIRIGVDLEHIRTDFPISCIARRFFCPKEAELIQASNGTARLRLFFDIWVRKEAYLKATGKGLTQALDSFDVPLDSLPIRLEDAQNTWLFSDLPVDKAYASSLVASPPPSEILIFDWPSQ